jgi:hypothetical protein
MRSMEYGIVFVLTCIKLYEKGVWMTGMYFQGRKTTRDRGERLYSLMTV